MEKQQLEKIREFLFDCDKVRKDLGDVYDLILKFNGIGGSSDPELEGLELQIDMGEIDGSDLQIWVTVDGESESVWLSIDEDKEDDLLRLESKEGDMLFNTKI